MTFGGVSRLALVLCAAGVAACADRPSELDPYVVTDSAGVRVVESSYPSARCRLSEEAVQAVPASEPEGPWGRVDDVALVGTGEVVVLDAMTSTIWFFDSAGQETGAYRAPGRGPMEIERFGGVFEVSGGVGVFDPVLRRISRFSLDGSLLDQVEVPDAGAGPWPSEYYFRASSRGRGTLLSPDMAPTLVHTGGRSETPYRLLDESAAGFVSQELSIGRRVEVFEGGAGSGPSGFGAFSSAAWQDGRVLRAEGDRFEVGVFRPDGVLEARWRRAWEGRTVSDSDRAEWVRHFVRQAGFGDPGDPAARPLRSMLEASVAAAREMPATSAVLAAPDGAIWVRSYQPPWDSSGARWSVFGKGGRWIMEVEDVPAAKRIWGVVEEGVWITIADTLGLERLEMRTTVCTDAVI